jgi:hypothetical protein
MKSQARMPRKFVTESKPDENNHASSSLSNEAQANSLSNPNCFIEMELEQHPDVFRVYLSIRFIW